MSKEDRFKFRAYNKELRKMYEVNTICPYEDNYTKGGEVFLKGVQYNSFYFPEEVEVMQCTGLKDKNGKLIYEGDIVKKTVFIDYQGDGQYQPDVYVDREYIGVVHFSASNGATLQKVKIFETGSPYEAKKQRGKRDCPKATKLIACRSEVIGNIYENKELIK